MKKVMTVLLAIIIIARISYVYFGPDKCLSKVRAALPGSTHNLVIQIQPFDDVTPQQSDYVFKEVKKIYSSTILAKPIKLPAKSYYKARNRYKADTIIQWLSDKTQKDYVTIGLTSKDVSTSKGNVPDWGIMGLAFQPGNSCVVSTYRLNKSNLLDQLFKVSIHELGHTQGLPHCEIKSCYMRDAEGHNTTDEEYEFCPKCKNELLNIGWVFK